jgi:hypothetical protein
MAVAVVCACYEVLLVSGAPLKQRATVGGAKFSMWSPAFKNTGAIPISNSCWTNGPKNTGSGLTLPL